MGNISAEELLDALLAHRQIAAGDLMSLARTPEFFRVVVEGLSDRFEADAAGVYAGVFAYVISRVYPQYTLEALVARYQQAREFRVYEGAAPAGVFVLSRVTLGADVAVTSVVLDAMKRRFPETPIWFVGARKNWELFEADERLRFLEAPYRRAGSLEERLEASQELRNLLAEREGIVVDPDSRLTQLGLMPVCGLENYYLFESRSPEGPGSLAELTARWLELTFGIAGAKAYVAPRSPQIPAADICVSLGVGGNAAKRVADPFERELLLRLAALNRSILVDKGAGGEETERVEAAIRGLPNVRTWPGAFAPFAAQITRSGLYVGYDSSGQHVAAASGIPLITVFAGAPNERFRERWRPTGPGRIDIVRGDNADPAAVIERVAALLQTSKG